MPDIPAIREGLDIIAEKTGNHQTAIEAAEGDVTKGIAKIAMAHRLVVQAMNEMSDAINYFDSAKERATGSKKDNLEVIQNVASAIELEKIGNGNLHTCIGSLTSTTEQLIHHYGVHSFAAGHKLGEKDERGLWYTEIELSSHLSTAGKQVVAMEFYEVANQTLQAARSFEI